MKIKKTAAALAALIVLSSVPASAKTLEFTIGSQKMYATDYANYTVEKTVLDCTPYVTAGRTLVPVRVISENFGAEVSWDEATQRVDISSDGTDITLYIGNNTAVVNGKETVLDVAPELTDSRTMVPLRFISEALGKRVEYVEPSEQVIISDDSYAISVGDFDISVDDIRFSAVYNGIISSTNAGRDNLEAALPELLNNITKNAILSHEAEKAGIKPDKATVDKLCSSILNIKDFAYDAGTLIAPGVKMLTNDLSGTQYLKTAELSADNKDFQDLYEQNYIRVKHILIKTYNTSTAEYYDEAKKAEMKKKIEGILADIKNGADFEKLHKEYNEDDESFFYPDGLIVCEEELLDSFAEVAFALEEGEISDIVETKYGYHIVKRIPLPEFDEKALKEIKYSLIPEYLKATAEKNSEIVYHMTNEEILNMLAK